MNRMTEAIKDFKVEAEKSAGQRRMEFREIRAELRLVLYSHRCHRTGKKIGFFSSCDRHILMLYCHGCHIILGIMLFPVPLLFRRYLSMIMCLTSLHFTSILHYFTSIFIYFT